MAIPNEVIGFVISLPDTVVWPKCETERGAEESEITDRLLQIPGVQTVDARFVHVGSGHWIIEINDQHMETDLPTTIQYCRKVLRT